MFIFSNISTYFVLFENIFLASEDWESGPFFEMAVVGAFSTYAVAEKNESVNIYFFRRILN